MKIRTSATTLASFQRCPRGFYYREIKGLVPKSVGKASALGTLYHNAAAAGYKGILRATKFSSKSVIEWLAAACAFLTQDGFVDRDGVRLFKDDETEADAVILIGDMLRFFAQEQLGADLARFKKILSVETRHEYTTPRGDTVTTTFDLCAEQKNGRIEVQDHKTVSEIASSFGFLELDTQLGEYELSAIQAFGVEVDIQHNFIRREVPPGFGHRPLRINKDGSEAKNNASRVVTDYLLPVRSTRTPKQCKALAAELQSLMDDLAEAYVAKRWRRTPIKQGPSSCQGSCSYFEMCKGELDGRGFALPNLVFNVAPGRTTFVRDTD